MLCRLCEGTLEEKFALTVLARYRASYFVCEHCGSLQTEPPYWLAEAYASNLAASDTGAAQRNLTNLAACLITTRILGLSNMIDYGGGDGLLCRLMRDYGINCYVKDKHAVSTYALSFTEEDFERPDLLTAFEVVEHFHTPATDLEALFGPRPKVVLLSTLLYSGQAEDWWYLIPDAGQHVFFYAPQSMELIASRYGYRLLFCGDYTLFVGSEVFSPVKAKLLQWLLKPLVLRIAKPLATLLPARGVWRDLEFLKERRAGRSVSARRAQGPAQGP